MLGTSCRARAPSSPSTVGWHSSRDHVALANITLLTLPPCSPELNPVENIWRRRLRQNHLANRVFDSYDGTVGACREAWNILIALAERITSIAFRDRAKATG